MQGLIGHESLQPRVLVAQPPQLLQFAQLHPTVLALPAVERCGADVRLPADHRDRLAALGSAENRDDLLRCMSLSFWHLSSFSWVLRLSSATVQFGYVRSPRGPSCVSARR